MKYCGRADRTGCEASATTLRRTRNWPILRRSPEKIPNFLLTTTYWDYRLITGMYGKSHDGKSTPLRVSHPTHDPTTAPQATISPSQWGTLPPAAPRACDGTRSFTVSNTHTLADLRVTWGSIGLSRRRVRDFLAAHDGNSDLGSHRPFRTPLFPGKFLESKKIYKLFEPKTPRTPLFLSQPRKFIWRGKLVHCSSPPYTSTHQ